VDNAFKILVDNATEEFVFVPRDVYSGLRDLPRVRDQHTAAVEKFNYARLQDLIREFSSSKRLDKEFSHNLIVVCPYPPEPLATFDKWAIDFKSVRIAKQAMESMRSQEDAQLQQMYDFFYGISASSTFSGWFFEAIDHHLFSNGWGSEHVLQPIPMVSNGGCGPLVFSTGSPSPTPDTSSHWRSTVPVPCHSSCTLPFF
jgi:hypothetical protein